MTTAPDARALAVAIGRFYAGAKRDLPWRRTRDPYAIWISEIMCQQTKVATAVPYWQRWLGKFPTATALADAPLDDVLAAWAGLGYYARARNLHRGATQIAAAGGALPTSAATLRAIAGIGPYTAAAIASIAYAEPIAVVDGNVARVVARVAGIDDDVKGAKGGRAVQALADAIMAARPRATTPGDINQGLMELGALVCTPRAPACDRCPWRTPCVARATDRQATLPVLPARKATRDLPTLRQVALWCANPRGEVLLARRVPTGLFGGLWELPQGTSAADAGRALGVKVRAERTVRATHAQVLSHRQLEVRVVGARLVGEPAVTSRYDAIAWVAPAAAASLGLAKSTTSLLTKLA